MEDIYKTMLDEFHDTLKNTSLDINKDDSGGVKYMTSCEQEVVNVDKLKTAFAKKMLLAEYPKSCDALYKTSSNEFFMIEFKNRALNPKGEHDLNEKILESLLLLSEKFSETIDVMRDKMYFILVYNEEKQEQKELRQIGKTLCTLAIKPLFGLDRFKKIYFKDVVAYTKEEFEKKFVSVYCAGNVS